MLLPFLGKKDEERRAIINTIGPHWDGNEVWLLTAGGATFAAFPTTYALMFSYMYTALLLLLFSLIVRGVAFEFRGTPSFISTVAGMMFIAGLPMKVATKTLAGVS